MVASVLGLSRVDICLVALEVVSVGEYLLAGGAREYARVAVDNLKVDDHMALRGCSVGAQWTEESPRRRRGLGRRPVKMVHAKRTLPGRWPFFRLTSLDCRGSEEFGWFHSDHASCYFFVVSRSLFKEQQQIS